MSATTLFYLLTAMNFGIFLMVIVCFWYGRQLLQRQKQLHDALIPYMMKVQSERETIHALSIPDTTPLSQLRDVSLPDNVDVAFQHESGAE